MKVLCSQEVVRSHRCSCPMSGHCKGVCIPDTMVCALVRGFPREVRRGWQSQKPLIFMHFHEVFLGSQHEIWSKQHNGKVSLFSSYQAPASARAGCVPLLYSTPCEVFPVMMPGRFPLKDDFTSYLLSQI